MSAYENLGEKLIELQHLMAANALLAWDQETMMPTGGAGQRARQMSTLQGMYHQMATTQIPSLLEAAEAEIGADSSVSAKRNLMKVRTDLERKSKLPVEHVKATSRAISEAFHAWHQAKPADDFGAFQPYLEKLLELKIQEAEYYGYEENPYDALLESYEPGLKASTVQSVFDGFKGELLDLLKEIKARPQVDEGFLLQNVEADAQLAYGLQVIQSMGYSLEFGRQDLAPHPFSISIAPTDVRITTMVDQKDIREMLYSTIHEAGHALYERGLPEAALGWPEAEACSLSIHESQSRLWENNVARSYEFCDHFFEPMRALFPDKLKGKTAEDLFKAVNRVSPNLVRISSDELTYHFHILLRFELELALVNRDLKVADLPAAWNSKVKEYLGIDVPSDTKGVLQDIHWSHGSFGYFPTYSLGSFYAAQFMAQAEKEITDLKGSFAQGQFLSLKGWLNDKIHRHGKLYNSEELCEMVTGEKLNIAHFSAYARKKFGKVYGIGS